MASLLQQLQEVDHLLGIISDTGRETGDLVNTVLKKAGKFSFFKPSLCLYSADVGFEKSTPAIFSMATERACLAGRADACLFVGDYKHEREQAEAAGLRICSELQSVAAIAGRMIAATKRCS